VGDSVEDWLSVRLASRKAGVSDRTIRNWIAKGKLQAKKEGGQWLIDPMSLSEIGNEGFQQVGKLERGSDSETLISVPLERYEGLITRLTQLEAENSKYKLMLESSEMKQERRRGWWSKLWKRHPDAKD
jgi:excisionase family DNA binding protein